MGGAGLILFEGDYPDGLRTEPGEELLKATREALRKCDPQGLIAIGCPDDEYGAEAVMLAAEIVDPLDVDRVAASARSILEKAFGEPFGDEGCRKLAEEIRCALARAAQGA